MKLYKIGRKIYCFITKDKKGLTVHAGKPSDSCCLCWKYDNLKDAEATAEEYIQNYKAMKNEVCSLYI